MRALTALATIAVLTATPSLASAQFLADLKPTYLSWSSGFSPGGRVTLKSTIKNIGAWPSSSTTSGYYLSANSAISTGDLLLSSFSTPGIGIGGSYDHTVTITVPHNVGAGTCYIGVFADHGDKLGELSNSNNTLAGKTTCYGKPNLLITNISSSTKIAQRGGTVVLQASIANHGGVAAGAFEVGYYLSTNSTISTGDRLLATNGSAGLSAGRYYGRSTNVVIPMDAPLGTNMWLGAYADRNGQISEILETDNGLGINIRVYAQGSFTQYGKACPGRAGTSTHSATNPQGGPYIDTTTTYRLTNGVHNFAAVFMLGFSKTQWGPITLPFALDGIGAPGCMLHISPDILLSIGTDANGSGSLALKHPNDVRLVGASVFSQFASIEFGFNSLGLTYSNGLESKFGIL
ncbi:MAG: hypothetical protein KDC95_21550 [Planctomycetes bacterium]|nr:hypothetical protein [Planctomycetota bacterium]